MNKKQEMKFKGHETFYKREGWIRKGVKALEDDKYILSDTIKGIDKLGVGANMVKSIRYWLPVLGITEENRGDRGKRWQKLSDFGRTINQRDPYFEDKGTLFLLHYNLAKNIKSATSWYLFFNEIGNSQMTKEEIKKALNKKILNIDPEYKISEKSLNDDINCIIKMYCLDKEDYKEPEDNLVSPFTILGLINKVKDKKVVKTAPKFNDLDRLIVLYVIKNNMYNGKTTINKLIEENNNIGKIFNLDKNTINEYVDILENQGYIEVNRTAGLKTISIKNASENILDKYYREQQG